MPFLQIIFYTFVALAVISALLILFTRNVLYADFPLIITFLCIPAVYVFAGADFITIAQVMVYVGGVLVLMIFGVMLTNKLSGKAVTTSSHYQFWGVLIGLAVFGILTCAILQVNLAELNWIQQSVASGQVIRESTVNTLGVQLMREFVLPFETAGILLLALIAAFIAKR